MQKLYTQYYALSTGKARKDGNKNGGATEARIRGGTKPAVVRGRFP